MFASPPPGVGPSCGTARVAAAQSALAAAADALAALTPSELADPLLSELMQTWDEPFNRIDAARTALVGAWDARGAWAADAAHSGAGWLAARTEQSRPAASGRIRLARALRAMPVVEAACASGRLGQAKAALLANAATHAPDTFAKHESFLVEQALGLRVDQCAKVLSFWARHANPDGAADRDAKQRADRSVHLSSSFGGMWLLNGKLTDEGGEALREELDRRCRAMYQADKALADSNGTPIERTAAQRRADALVDLAMQSLAAGDDGTAVKAPSVTAIVHVDHLTHPDTVPSDVVGETEHGAPVTAATALRWACDGSLARVVLDADSVPVDLGNTARLPSPAQRRALAARDRGCVFPGCDRHAGWTHAHHLVHWIHGGATDLANLALLCVYHHHRVHEGGFGVARQADGSLHFTRPDGTALVVPKGRAPDPLRPKPG